MNLIAATVQAATGCTPTLAALYAPHLSDACVAYGITTPTRLAAFLAQIGHESGSLKFTAELWGPTPAQTKYEGRADLGNVEPGDGERFKGHGLIQVTGRFNHVKCRDRLRAKLGDHQVPDFERVPDALEQPRWAAWSAAEYWASHGCNELADSGDFKAITLRINGALNGQPDRLERWAKAKAALDVQPIDTSAEPVQKPPENEHVPEANFGNKEGSPMAPIIAALLPSLLKAIPKLGALFAKSENAERNVKAAEVAFRVAQDALGASNEQEVIQRIQSSPAEAQKVAEAVEAEWFLISQEVGGGIPAAREADAKASQTQFWHSPAFWISLLLMPLIYGTVYIVLTGKFSSEVQSMVVAAVVSGVLGSITGFFLGGSFSSQRKDQVK